MIHISNLLEIDMAMPVGGFKKKQVNTGSKWQKLCFQDSYSIESNIVKKVIGEVNLETGTAVFGMRNFSVVKKQKTSEVVR